MKRTKQWNTASKWRRLCHQAGQLILYTVEPFEVNVSNTIHRWITIIKTTGYQSSSKQFCTIQIKVTMNTLQLPHMIKAWVTDHRNMWTEGEVLSNITPRLRADLAGLVLTPKSSIGNVESYLLCCLSFPIRRNLILSGFSFSLLVDIDEWTEAKHYCKPFSANADSPDAKETYCWLSSAQRRWGIVCSKIMLLNGVV